MKIVWLCATALPEVNKHFGFSKNYGMTWLIQTAHALKNAVDLTIIFPNHLSKETKILKQEDITYYSIPFKHKILSEHDFEIKEKFEKVLKTIKPDIIHIWGTEFPFEYDMVKAAEANGMLSNCVVSIQGLTSIYSEYYFGFIPHSILKKPSIGDILKRKTVYAAQRDMKRRGEYEVELLKIIPNVIGRTDWDKACTYQINNSAKYYHCDETLREIFYNYKWHYKDCKKYSIFVSQGGYPIKGFDIILKAASILKERYPNLEIRVAGDSPLAKTDFISKIKVKNYEKYYLKLIQENDLEENVKFLGGLSADEMCREYLNANAYALCSIIENSPNSMGEAMLLGTPSVVSTCGGVQQLFNHGRDGFLYQPGAYYMLAYYLEQIFEMEEKVEQFSENARRHAVETHSVEKNRDSLLGIYKDIFEKT